jgi:hypothetical protein
MVNYTNENIIIILVCGKEAPKSIQDGSALFDPEQRTTKYAYKGISKRQFRVGEAKSKIELGDHY